MAPEGGGELILVVDDRASERDYLRDLFEMEGFQVEIARHGGEALELIETLPVRTVVTDLNMPGVDGMAVLDRLHADHPELPVILLTGHGSLPVGMKAMAHGAFYFLEKPAKGDHLLALVRRALEFSARSPSGN